ncbi:polysaccharide deacetylase family protein [Actinomycetospora cinnamomea]|uniref:Peptidoglycan/xylan/chitin deacetylase (PgdA/CDA1 family) n=1 Tax=Actinomycetospora cinnamomea TaxID=663609 RepID=A0A2U1EXD9_9PSEU|nr:polysaccharide deacetylase family protein [Actinomycetospora cinnamomea]PVZ04576.1 peptidoglycan/xylan/chitin deacetylase (PgdA/CDA1 family) [Actinomycetospora cinnamomea]
MTARWPWILMYHSVGPTDDDPFHVTVSPRRFRAQMDALRRAGRRGVSMRTLLATPPGPLRDRMVGLTFDDGYADFADVVVDVLDEYGFDATVYVVAGRLGRTNDWESAGAVKPLMTPARLREVAALGMEVAAHGVAHRPLAGLAPEDLEREVVESRLVLEDVLGARVTGFAYPYGSVDLPAHAAVREAGYEHGVAVRRAPRRDVWTIPRTFVGEADTPARLVAKCVRSLRDRTGHRRAPA